MVKMKVWLELSPSGCADLAMGKPVYPWGFTVCGESHGSLFDNSIRIPGSEIEIILPSQEQCAGIALAELEARLREVRVENQRREAEVLEAIHKLQALPAPEAK